MTSLTATFILATSILSVPPVPAAPQTRPALPISAAVAAIAATPSGDQAAPSAGVIRGAEVVRPKMLMPMYLALTALQGYDVYSTTKALGGGALEANPLMRSVARHPAALIAVKTAATLSSVLVAERLWRSNHRTAAVVLMAVSGGMMAVVAANNARVLREVR